MHFDGSLTKNKSNGSNNVNFVMRALLRVLAYTVPTLLLLYYFKIDFMKIHTLVETICIFIALFIFVISWYTYERNTTETIVLGFGFLTIALLNTFHVYLNLPVYSFSTNSTIVSTRFWLITSLIRAFVLLIFITGIIKIKWNKFISLGISLIVPALCISLLIFKPSLILPFYIRINTGAAIGKYVGEFIIIAVFLFDIILLSKKKRNFEIDEYYYTFLALLTSIAAELCFVLEKNIIINYAAMGHMLKLCSFILLFKGIFAKTIIYPYKKLKESNDYTAALLDKLVQQDRLAVVGNMGASIVHETKNFLSVIKGSSQLLNLLVQDKKIKDIAQRIDNATNEVNKIVSGFLSLSKPSVGVYSPTSINLLLQSMKTTLETSSLLSGIDVDIQFAEEDKFINCDEAQIRQVILNICKNSIEAMSQIKNPLLAIKAYYNASRNEISVSFTDNGKGISDEEKEHIGKPFYTTKEKGTGLGLGVCYKIIGDHGGRIDIESELGKGTKFIFSLPCIDDE